MRFDYRIWFGEKEEEGKGWMLRGGVGCTLDLVLTFLSFAFFGILDGESLINIP
jgi:hypothetical protein